MLFLLWYVYKWLFDLFVKKYLLAMYSFLFKKKKKQLWSYGQQCSTFYKQKKKKLKKNKNLTYLSLW